MWISLENICQNLLFSFLRKRLKNHTVKLNYIFFYGASIISLIIQKCYQNPG